ncbi:hypothetical protein [Aeromicrobium sp.]|uniref:hypothetical protein n=1 Tax=Aeromicrobium sp. TaxID=1871063 RepID=UPI003C353A99
MGHGFRSALRLAATIAAAAVIARVADSAMRSFGPAAVAPPRHRSGTAPARMAVAARRGPNADVMAPVSVHLESNDSVPLAPPEPHPFGPTRAVPCRSIGSETPAPAFPDQSATRTIELEASGELDDTPSAADRLLARRHASELTS